MSMQLNAILRRNPIASPKASDFWPIPNQYIGVEIETERMPASTVAAFENSRQSWWAVHQDASLRNGGLEFVLAQPTMGDDLVQAISFFYRTFSRPWDASGRTSTHIHINMQQEEDTTDVLRALVALYYAVEPAIFACVSEDRKWSGYCNTLDARGTECLSGLFAPNDSQMTHWYNTVHVLSRSPGGRYYGFNLSALLKYGTIEFRHFPCATNQQQLTDYIFLVMELKKAAQIIAQNTTSDGVLAWFMRDGSANAALDLMTTWGRRLALHTTQESFSSRAGKLAAHSAVQALRPGIGLDHKVVAKFLGQAPAKKAARKRKAPATDEVFDVAPDTLGPVAGLQAVQDYYLAQMDMSQVEARYSSVALRMSDAERENYSVLTTGTATEVPETTRMTPSAANPYDIEEI